ncbi:MAG: TolB protein [Actinomycetota bacterium]
MGKIRRTLRKALCPVATVVAVLATGLAAPVILPTVPAVFAGATGKLAFERDGDIWTANGDGTGQVRLTTDPGQDDQPAWSPDGRQIAFISNRPLGSGAPFLYVMDADGSDQHQVGAEIAWTPSWSPDGRLVYQEAPGGKLHVINADGTGLLTLTNGPGHDFHPSWSPDGSRIAFTSDRDGEHQIYAVDADGSDQTRLTTTTGYATQPDWSPDGSRLAFSRGSGTHTMHADGSGQVPLVAAPANSPGNGPKWSPDGTRFAVTAWVDAVGHIDVMRADGTRRSTVLTDATSPSWQPVTPATGRLVFHSPASGRPALYTSNADGSDTQPLFAQPEDALEVYPAWSPDGSKVAFLSTRGNQELLLWVANADGTDAREIGGDPGLVQPAWSPDGTRLAYSSGGYDPGYRIRLIGVDGTGDTEVPGQTGANIWPTWSPDGRRIAFASSDGESSGIHVMDADGSNHVPLTSGPDDDTPDWSPDGRLIAFTRNGGEIHVMAPDGTDVRNVTGTPDVREVTPKWSPDGSRMAFMGVGGTTAEGYVATMDAADGSDRQTATGIPASWIDWQPSVTLAPAVTSAYSVSDATLTEGDSGTTTAVFTVTLSPASTSASTVHYATSNGTASSASDYSATSGDLSFDVGVTTKTISVPIAGDTAVEPNETFTVALSAPTGETTLGDATGTGTITNDDSVPTRPVRVAAVGLDSRLYIGNGYGGAFRAEGGIVGSGPALARVPKSDGSALALEVVTGNDRRLYVKREGAAGFVRLSNRAVCLESPAAVVAPVGVNGAPALVVACMGQDRALWYDVGPVSETSTPVLDSFESLGGILTAGPAVAMVQNALTFMVRGNDGRIYSRGTSGGYLQTNWFCQGHPALASWSTTAYFACAGNDTRLYAARNGGSGWGTTESLGGIARGGPGLAVTPDEAVIFIRGADDAVWQTSVSPTRGNTPFARLPSAVLFEVGATAL